MKPKIVELAERHKDRIAIVDRDGEHTYAALLDASANVAARLLAGDKDLEEKRVAFLVPPGFAYVAVQWGIWRAGGIAVPMATSHPPPELDYVIRDAAAAWVIAAPEYLDILRPLAHAADAEFMTTDTALASTAQLALPDVPASRRAMMVYTSGTTGRAKGVVTTHANLAAQITALITAWGWTAEDRIALVLPLHHVHGIVNVVCCALWSCATVEMYPKFDADQAWDAIGSGRLTLFMAVPTIYKRLIAAWEGAPAARGAELSAACKGLRLMVSGSAALPVQTLERWREISGHTLLERYGMTEIGMGLSNPLNGERRPGFVGAPLPGVEARLVGEAGTPVPDGTPGEIEIRGPAVFLEYWRREDATRAAFRNGWFRTGDTAVVERGSYRILGRTSVDILNPGGYKVSALEIEEVLRTHPAIQECAVVGIETEEHGESIAVAAELKPGADLELADLKAWAKERLAPYKVPHRLALVPALPRNAMGKVMKPEVVKLFGAPKVMRPSRF